MKICALLVPKEMKQHSAGVKDLTDEQLDQAIEALRAMIDQNAGDLAKVVDVKAESVALPAPDVVPDDEPKRPNKVLAAADTAVGPSERKTTKRPPGT